MPDEDGIRLSVRLTPNGGRDALEGFQTDAAGGRTLRARVRAVPEDGKANTALIVLLAKHFRVAKSAVSLVSGATARQKILRIEGDPEDLKKTLDAL